MDNDEQVTALVRRWAGAVHQGDLETLAADHADDIVMFDVPPPHRGARGIEAYRKTWPAFLAWQRSGATFEIDEMSVTAGADVAYVYALVRCGKPDPGETLEPHLRLTLGLRYENGRWVVAHEHHSFADTSAPA